MKKIPITIAIPAYNEEHAIENMYQSLRWQQEDVFTIKKILIVLDGSTDNTFQVVKKIPDKRIEIHYDHKRKGKSQRLNEIFQMVETDVLVLLDADIILAKKDTLENLIKPFLEKKKVALVAGCIYPEFDNTFLSQSISCSFYAYDKIRRGWNNGKNVYSCAGSILALSKSFAKSITIPSDISGNDAYLFLSCMKQKLPYVFAQNATITYHNPTTLADLIKRNKRYARAPRILQHIFGKLAKEAYAIPFFLFFRSVSVEFFKKPLHTIAIFTIILYCHITAKYPIQQNEALWDIVYTTK